MTMKHLWYLLNRPKMKLIKGQRPATYRYEEVSGSWLKRLKGMIR